ncbi:ribosome small subunit-dependent GTPase A [Spirilliplanes yamanashiensis]|uniref:Small ribosomal subunit biogenesis GTPase RsgA n=1 Tax=Spirilliplanes yamanashiensis TaxID=42233 RepID=A0A8J3Y8Q4_9ACTN|nr:ribosome small subunit-dependent GTPase A [Spirilliplanes yamanashiensis]MDP9817064.1 ribosome biogenesis GTPase [Spirilliplanes yamanashiensis]GIJ03280.1 putative ribosome biogenesis GTPase RsgA [Spirilliplanes yamanashiensis]
MTLELASLGWDAALADAYRPFDRADAVPGRVSRADRGVCTVLTTAGAERASLGGGVLLTAAADPARLPCAGDWVVVRRWPDRRTTCEAVLPRRTAVIRRTADKDASGQVLAANVDVAAVVEPVHPEPDAGRIERLLALAWESGARPVVILSKCDTAAEPGLVARQLAGLAPGVPVLPVSAERGEGVAAVARLIGPGRTLGLLGASGAGKSTLVNALAGASVMGTQAIRRVDGKGRHTTTFRALVPLPGGGAVIDTPGLRGVGLLDAATGLDRAFADVTELAALCRFRDCSHHGEPGCAVAEALATGELTARRLDSYRALHRETAYETSRREARAGKAAAAMERRARRR